MLRFAVGLKERKHQKCTPKNLLNVFGVNDPFSEKFRNYVPKEIHDDTDSRFMFKCTEIGHSEVGQMMRYFGPIKVCSGFSPPFCACLAKGAKSLHGCCHLGRCVRTSRF